MTQTAFNSGVLRADEQNIRKNFLEKLGAPGISGCWDFVDGGSIWLLCDRDVCRCRYVLVTQCMTADVHGTSLANRSTEKRCLNDTSTMYWRQ